MNHNYSIALKINVTANDDILYTGFVARSMVAKYALLYTFVLAVVVPIGC